MARKAEATLWMLVKIGKRSVMKRVVKKGRSYVPKVECPYEPGSYYLRYTQNANPSPSFRKLPLITMLHPNLEESAGKG